MRNENGFGSIICLDKTGKKRRKPWAVRITTGWVNGKQQRKYLGYYATQKDALVALADYHNSGANLETTKMTLEDVWVRWFDRLEKKETSKSIMNNHRMVYNRLQPFLNKQFNTIKTAHLQEWMDGIELKPSTKQKLRSTMVQLFDFAIKNDIVTKNYAKFIEIDEKVEAVGSIFTTNEVDKLWELYRTKKDIDARLLLMLIYSGMRINEILAVERDNINFEEQYLIGGSKTDAGKDRVIPIHDELLPLFKESIGDGKYLVTNNRGGKMSYSSAHQRCHKFFTTHGFDHTIHDTRRTTISLLHTANVPMATIKIIVGHSGDSVTEKVYLFKEPNELVQAINMIKI